MSVTDSGGMRLRKRQVFEAKHQSVPSDGLVSMSSVLYKKY